jgi:ABC-type branched-subunit amino acid transport system ATPase component
MRAWRACSTWSRSSPRRTGAAGLLSGGEQQMLAFGRALMSLRAFLGEAALAGD